MLLALALAHTARVQQPLLFTGVLVTAVQQQLHHIQQPAFSSWWPAWRRGQAQQRPLQEPPRYPAIPQPLALGTCKLTDSFSYLHDHEQARPYLRQEQLYFQQAVRAWSPLTQQLAAELRQHLASAQFDSPPEAVGGFVYGSQHNPHGEDTLWRSPLLPAGVSARQQQQQEGAREVLLSDALIQQDVARLQQLTGISIPDARLADVKLSRDHQLLAYSLASASDDHQPHCCVVRQLNTGQLLPHLTLPSVGSFEWSADGACLYFTQPDAAGRPSKVFMRLVAGTAADRAVNALLYEDPDAKHFITLTRTKDWRFVVINTHAKLSSEVHLLDAADCTARPVCVHPRQPGLEYFVEHHAGHLLLLANCSPHNPPDTAPQAGAAADAAADAQQQCRDYSLFSLPAAAVMGSSDSSSGCAARTAWQLLLAESPGTAIIDLDAFQGALVLHEMRHSTPGLRLLQLSATGPGQHLRVTRQQQVALPDWALWLQPGINQDYHSSSFRVSLSSPAHPQVAVDVCLATASVTPVAGQHQPAAVSQQQPQQQLRPRAAAQHPPQGISSRRLWAAASDSTPVPVTLLQPAGAPADGSSPLLVEVYGAYGHMLEADYKPHRLPLLQRGWSVALAHVRGGGELGRRWHAGGRQLLKRNSVLDLLACLDHLVRLGVTRPGAIAAHAASAGCLTLAAAINARPEWFAAAVLEAPFVDLVAGTGAVSESEQRLDDSQLLTEHEGDEWGHPWQQPAAAELISSLCPYTTLQPAAAAAYPALLVTAGLQDNRVPFWMPLKFVAKLRSMQQQQDSAGLDRVLLQFDEAAGHFSMGVSGCSLEDVAGQQAFLLHSTPRPDV